MGLLDARKNAEKIAYPVVGEEEKDASNVIDYDIRDELTIEGSSVFNANNNTSTGMANVIPGINAPKLIANTSIYGDFGYEVGGVNISGSRWLNHPYDPSGTIRNWTLSGERGDLGFSVIQDSGLRIPETGWYQFEINYPVGGSNRYIVTDIRYVRGGGASQDLIYHVGQASSTQETEVKRVELNKGDIVYAVVTLNYIGTSSEYQTNASMSINITKL